MADETKKVWKVLLGVPADKLEDMLNAHVEEGLQAYRMDRYEVVHPVYDDRKVVKYDVVLFNPQLLGERAAKPFTDAVIAQIAAMQGPSGPAPGA